VIKNFPKHIAIIMDGNGRWATERCLSRIAGHKAGLQSVREVIETCADLGVEALSLFAFSSENWGRPETEVAALMQLFHVTLQREVAELHAKHVMLRFIGCRDKLSPRLLRLMHSSEALTASNTGLKLIIALDYGGTWDLVNATRQLAQQVASGELMPESIDEALLKQHLATGQWTDPDLFIRTSGEQRLSNFYLLQLAYTELYFFDGYWPDFRRDALHAAIAWFQSRERRYGTTAQMRKTKCLDSD
jgi:undecaprenyl diphosphate synthase